MKDISASERRKSERAARNRQKLAKVEDLDVVGLLSVTLRDDLGHTLLGVSEGGRREGEDGSEGDERGLHVVRECGFVVVNE